MKELNTQYVYPTWDILFENNKQLLLDIDEYLNINKDYTPTSKDIFNAFRLSPENVKVIILGQDPYPTPGHAMGLSFSVQKDIKPIPKSLINIFKEYQSDLGYSLPNNGDLKPWLIEGVLLLNTCLTTQKGIANAHKQKLGWEKFTSDAIKYIIELKNKEQKPLMGILWGKQAQEYKPLFDKYGFPTICSSHPSPFSANLGFLGSKPFSKVNKYLIENNSQPINWQL